MSVSTVDAVRVNPSQPTLHVEALSLGNLSTKLVSLASISLPFHQEVQISGTHTVYLCTNSKARYGTGRMLRRYADVSLAVHPATSENIPGRPLDAVFGPELQHNQTIYVLIIQERGWTPAARTVTPFSLGRTRKCSRRNCDLPDRRGGYYSHMGNIVHCVRAACGGEC